MDDILNDLRFLEQEIAVLKDPNDREQLTRHIHLLISRVQAERNYLKLEA